MKAVNNFKLFIVRMGKPFWPAQANEILQAIIAVNNFKLFVVRMGKPFWPAQVNEILQAIIAVNNFKLFIVRMGKPFWPAQVNENAGHDSSKQLQIVCCTDGQTILASTSQRECRP